MEHGARVTLLLFQNRRQRLICVFPFCDERASLRQAVQGIVGDQFGIRRFALFCLVEEVFEIRPFILLVHQRVDEWRHFFTVQFKVDQK